LTDPDRNHPTGCGTPSAAVTKSMSSSTARSSGISRSAYECTEPRMRRQTAGGSGGSVSAAQTPSFHGTPPWYDGPAFDTECRGLHRLPDVDVRVAQDQDGRVADLCGDPRFLRAGDEVVGQDADASARPRAEVPDRVGQVVQSVEQLDHDAFDPQVVAPYLLDELRIMLALDKDPAGAGDACPSAGDLDRSRCCPCRWRRSGGRPAGDRRYERDRLALEQEARVEQWERPPGVVPVLKLDGVLVARDHCPAEPRRTFLDDEICLGVHDRGRFDGPESRRADRVGAVVDTAHPRDANDVRSPEARSPRRSRSRRSSAGVARRGRAARTSSPRRRPECCPPR